MFDWLTNAWASLQAQAADKETLIGSGWAIWTEGGWAMIALAAISVFIFSLGFGIFLRLRRKRLGRLDESTWRTWIHEKADRTGPIGDMFDRVDQVIDGGRSEVHDAFAEIRAKDIEPYARDLKLMQIAVGAAPLVGLLGTVTGMLATFSALSNGSGGDQTMQSIAKGISEALYTTETGLVVALPGLFFHYLLSRRFEKLRNFLVHVEAVWAQDVLTEDLDGLESRQKELVRAVAHLEIKKRILARLQPARA